MFILKKVIYLVLLFTVIPASIAAAPISFQQLYSVLQQPAVSIGGISFIVIYYTYLKHRIQVFQTLDHELSHALISLLFGHKVTELRASDHAGGHTLHRGNNHNFLISLAPYVWRIPMLLLIFVLWLLDQDHLERYYLVAFGAVFAYRSICIFEEARPYQNDLQKVGYIKAYLWIICLNILWIGVLATVVNNRYDMAHYGEDIYDNLYDYFNLARRYLIEQLNLL